MGTLLEREGELRTLDEQLTRAAAGDGSLVVVEGPAGIGKTQLLTAARAMARERGFEILQGRGGVLEQDVPFGLVRQLVERTVALAPVEQRDQLLSGPAAPAAAVLGLAPPPENFDLADPTPQILHALHWLVLHLTDAGPLLICVDDAHWGDLPSLRAGHHIARRLEGLPVAIVLAARNDEPTPTTQLLTELVTTAEPWRVLRPGPLSEDAAGSVVRAAFGGSDAPESLVRACHRAARGNPFLLRELAGDLAADHRAPADVALDAVEAAGPVAVRRSILLRLGRMPPAAHALARAVAILGGEADPRTAARLADLDEEAAARAADLLTEAGLFEPRRRLTFVHPLVRAAVAEDLPPAARAAAHRRAIEVLRAEQASDDAILPHALAAAPAGDPEVVALLRRTALRAQASGAPDVAARELQRALEEPPAAEELPGLLAALGAAQLRGGDFAGGRAMLDRAASLHARPSSLALERAYGALLTEGLAAAAAVVADAVEEAEADHALELEAELALLTWMTGADHPVLDRMEEHRAVPGETPAERTVLSLLSQLDVQRGIDADGAVELALRALGDGRLLRQDTGDARSWYLAVYTLLNCEAIEEATVAIEAAVRDAQRRGSAFAFAGAMGTRAVLSLLRGRLRDAEADARSSASELCPPALLPVGHSYTVLALVAQGDVDGAEQVLTAAGLAAAPAGPSVLRWHAWARARLRLAQGRPTDALVDLDVLREDEAQGRAWRALPWRLGAAEAWRALGDEERAAQLADEQLAWARAWGRPLALGLALAAAAPQTQSPERLEALAAAAGVLADAGAAHEEARVRCDLGVSLMRAGRRSDGRQELTAALELAVTSGARGVEERVREELEIAGAKPQRHRFDELTASERRVAEMAADGLSNREIAAALFVTPKTVENQLGRAYGKLGISSRRDLAGVL